MQTDYRSLFDRDYIGHFDLPGGKDTTLTIKRVVGGELTAMGGRKSRKPIIHFTQEGVKPLIANKTNSKTISGMYGNIVEAWAGKRVTLYVSMTRNPDGGGEVECIRIRPKIPASKADTTIEPGPQPEEHIQQTPTITDEEALKLNARCEENNIKIGVVKKFFSVVQLSELTPQQLVEAHAMIDDTLAKRKETSYV